jgi:hypothetical protein
MTAKFGNFAAPATEAEAIVNDAAFSEPCRAIYVGVAGDVSAKMSEGAKTTVVFKNAPAGSILPVSATIVTAANTSATNLIALF